MPKTLHKPSQSHRKITMGIVVSFLTVAIHSFAWWHSLLGHLVMIELTACLIVLAVGSYQMNDPRNRKIL